MKKIPKGHGDEIQLADAINIVAKQGNVEEVLFEGQRFDCGSVSGYLEAIQEAINLKKNERSLANIDTCFKAYDIRGLVNNTLDEAVCYSIARAFQNLFEAKKVVLGRDNRSSSPNFSEALASGLIDSGCDVIDIGLSGTEEVYFATTFFNADAGLQITASHNPANYNGIKMVRKESKPIDPDTHLKELKRLIKTNSFPQAHKKGSRVYESYKSRDAYCQKVMSFVDLKGIRPQKIVVNCGGGAVAPAFRQIKSFLRKIIFQ